ncbi:conserved Plasmodium protein, unknown function [Plasmodium relictum]|uniref:Uncharacterized protein n=1 Tax=Plasmodium relictum TaxID=85471 RepID=A0A1J1H977_PLARL|nr:conserved Plasmodium protein, unknown function [Plasmodium relictum]CRH01351.1 conserved Plasmodium protein, unknown function [Plasmodium relictum]
MLCLDKEDELKIYKKFNLHSYENRKNNNSNDENFRNEDKLKYVNNNQNDANLKSRKNIIDIDIGDEIIYTNTSTCNSFIYVITKFCFYIFDNYDFSFINIYALKYDHINNYGCHNKVFLSSIDNTIYIISKNLKYVYTYYIVNKNDVVILDYDKNAHSFNINEHSDGDLSENENEYYEYITYIKNIYRKKKVHKNLSIKLITMLYLPITSNCLMVTKNNILFFSHETDEIFISDNVQNILSNSPLSKNEKNVNKVVINTKIVCLKNIKYKRKRKRKNKYSNKNKANKEINFISTQIRNSNKKFGVKNCHIYYSLKKGKVRKFINSNFTYRNVIKYCSKIKYNIARKCKKKKKKKDFYPFYLYSINKENNLYSFIKNKNPDDEKKKKYKNSIAIKGIIKVEFNVHNDYLLLLSSSNDLYIFSFFHNFFNFSKKRCCYYSGKNVHKKNYRKYNEKVRQENELKFEEDKKKKVTKVRTQKKDVIGLYVGSSIIDVSLNIFRKIILIINNDLTIKAYSTYPYICKHTFKRCLFSINIFNSSNDNIYYYNFLIWNKQYNFFLLSFNENNYYIFNTNGTLYYSMKNDFCKHKEKNENNNELKKFQMEYSMHFSTYNPDFIQDKNNNFITNSRSHSSNNLYTENIINDKKKKNRLDNFLLNNSKIIRITNSVMNISFVFNDFKLFYIKNMDENYYYINVKKILYLNDIYSNNKTFHYNSNYYTNQNCKKIYIGLNNIVMFDTNINNYNINDYEKNNVNIKEIITPFKFIKKSYLNFNNTHILIIFKSICIYNIQKKIFSYFLDDYLKYFFHNYPSGWLFEDIFFVTCLHNKYDEYNFKHFKKKNDYYIFKNNGSDNRKIRKKENVNFKVYNINYHTDVNIEYEENIENKNEEYCEYEDEVEVEVEGEVEDENDENNVEVQSEEEECDLEELRILNYLFNFNHNESDTYFKFFEEYFNINKCNLYTKPFSLFYDNFFLKKDRNVFLKTFLEHKKDKVSINYEDEKSFDEIIGNEKIKCSNSLYYLNILNKKIIKSTDLNNKLDIKKNENLDDTCLNSNINDNYNVYDLSENSTSSNNESTCRYKKNEFIKRINNSYNYSSDMKNIKKKNEKSINEMTKNYEEILNKNNFYYVIYFYNLNNSLKFTNYVCSIRLLYRPILTHVYYDKSLEEKKKNDDLNERFLIVLDAFYNLLCFKITEIKNHVKKSQCFKTENIFILPLNKDNNFLEPSCFYSIFDIYNYVFINYDNSIYFLHIYMDHNNCYDFQFTHIFENKLDYLEVVKDNENIFYYSLPSPIKYIWPNPIYYIYMFYYYATYIIYKINKTNKKSNLRNLLFPFSSNERNKQINHELLDNICKLRENKLNLKKEKKMNIKDSDETNVEEKIEVSIEKSNSDVTVNELLPIENNKISLKGTTKNFHHNDNIESSFNYKSSISSTESLFSFDLFCLNPFNNNIKNSKYKKFENVFKDKLNKHSLNYQNLIKLKKNNNKECDYWIRSKKEALTYINNLNRIFEIFFFCNDYEEENKKKKESVEIDDKNKIYEHQGTFLENFFSFLLHNFLRNHKKFLNKINKIFKYSLYDIIEELENKEDTCYLYVSRNNYINVISISKCSNNFSLMKELKNKIFFQKSNYKNCDLFIYRYMKLKKFSNEHNFYLHHIIHNMGLFLNIICNQIPKENIKEISQKKRENIRKYVYSKDISEVNLNKTNHSCTSVYDKIIFQFNSYIDIILFKFLKLYSDVYAYRGNKYEYTFDSRSKKKEMRYLIVNIILKYIRQNLFVVNILDIILYKSLIKLNDLYIITYKLIYNYLNNLCNTHYYDKFITKDRMESILNISIIVLYNFFLKKNYKKKNIEILENSIFYSLLNRFNNKTVLFSENEEINKKLKEEIFVYSSESNSNPFSNDEPKINILEKNVKNEHIYHMIFYLLRLKDDNATTNKEEKSAFEIKSDYAYKINYNIYYIVLYIICILKKKYVFHLYTLLKILKKYCKFHVSEVVINTIRKMDPYISAILIYSIGRFNPHDFMQLCLKNERFNISSLYIINVQNYIGIYDVRKFYCIYFLSMSLRYNIKYSKSLIHYLSILFYVLFKNKKNNRLFHWNYFGLKPPYVKSLKRTCKNSNNFLPLLQCAYNLNNIESREVIDINDLQFFFENSLKSHILTINHKTNTRTRNHSISHDQSEETRNSANNDIYSRELDKLEKKNRFSLNIRSFRYKKFKMNKIIYEFFYNYDIINISNKNIDTFFNLHTCNNNVFDYYSSKNKNGDGKLDDEKNFNYEEIKNIYIKFIILIQNIVCHYIYNMLWFELYYFITYLKIDILSFFSYSYFFKSNLFQNIFWGICPIDIAQYSINFSDFYFLNFNHKEKLTQEKHINVNKKCNHYSGNNNSMNNKSNLKEPYEMNNVIKFNDKTYDQLENTRNNIYFNNVIDDNCNKISKYDSDYGNDYSRNYDIKKIFSKGKSYINSNYSSKGSISETTNYLLFKNKDDSIKNTLIDDNYIEYIKYMKKLKHIFDKVEKENEMINKTFFENEQTNIFLIDIYKSFKNHFDIKCCKKTNKRKDNIINYNKQKKNYINKTKLENKKKKYRENILSFNIYNKHTSYVFLETYFAPSVYKYIPVYNTIKYLFYFFNICNKNSNTVPKKYLKYQIKKRIYDYVCNSIIDLKKKIKDSNKSQRNKTHSVNELCSLYRNDIIWFLLRIFILLKLPIHALALILYCKNYVLLNILLNVFPYLHHIFNYVLNMNDSHFSYRKMDNGKVKSSNIDYEESKKHNFILINEQFNKQFCEYCYYSILHYKKKNIIPFSVEVLEIIYKKKINDKSNNMYDHYMSCHCLNNLIFLKKKLTCIRKSI